MGARTAQEIADTDLTLSQQISWHFSGNCYPPVPQFMVEPAIEAINACNESDYDLEIALPDGVQFRGSSTVSASKIVDSLRLDAWLVGEE
jgi:hypothetical protein